MNIILPLVAPTLALSGALQPAPVPENKAVIIETTSHRRSIENPILPWPQVFLVRTEFLGSTQERRLLGCYDCGSMYYQYTTVLRLRDVFSDGTAKNYTRSAKPA